LEKRRGKEGEGAATMQLFSFTALSLETHNARLSSPRKHIAHAAARKQQDRVTAVRAACRLYCSRPKNLAGLGLAVVGRRRLPVDDVPPRGDVLGAAVLVLEVVGVLLVFFNWVVISIW
jgi:hypothetical protein